MRAQVQTIDQNALKALDPRGLGAGRKSSVFRALSVSKVSVQLALMD
jgi:hypothetical protein